MNFKRVMTVYKKEMLEMFRDKRTILSTIVLPFVLYPILFVGVSSLMIRQTAKLEKQGATLMITDSINDKSSQIIVNQLHKIENFDFLPVSTAAQKMYQDKVLHCIITIRDSLQDSGIPVYIISVQLDKSTDRGKLINEKVGEALKKAETDLLKYRLAEHGLNAEIVSTITVTQKDTSSAQKKLGSLLGAILPYLLIMLLIAGASVVAGDLVAGEKERKTLETLLVSSAHRNEIVMGKYFTVITFALINVAVNLFSLYFSMRNIASQSGLALAGVKFPTNGFLMLFLALIPLATLYAAILLSISTFSRNMKETRSYEQPILLVSMLLAMSSFFPAIELNNGLALIPVINISLLFKAVMMNDYKLSHLLITIGSTLVLDIAAIFMTVKLFNNEGVLFRSETDSNLKQLKKNKRLLFTPYYGLIYFALALLALYYIGSRLQAKNIVNGLVQTQAFIILLPVLFILRIGKHNIPKTLKMNSTPLANYLVVPLFAISGAVLAGLIGQIINAIYPFPEDYLKNMNELLKMPDLKIWQLFGLIALLPGICEEIMFRGFIYRFFENKSKWYAIWISAFLFALYHLDPYRFLPVLFLGVLLGWLLSKTNSIFPSMLSHAINNSTALLVVQFADTGFIKNIVSKGENFQWWVAGPAFLVMMLSIYLLNRINKPCKNDPTVLQLN
jgi:sodium transport system permease protein